MLCISLVMLNRILVFTFFRWISQIYKLSYFTPPSLVLLLWYFVPLLAFAFHCLFFLAIPCLIPAISWSQYPDKNKYKINLPNIFCNSFSFWTSQNNFLESRASSKRVSASITTNLYPLQLLVGSSRNALVWQKRCVTNYFQQFNPKINISILLTDFHIFLCIVYRRNFMLITLGNKGIKSAWSGRHVRKW